jgi:hypothetical protein
MPMTSNSQLAAGVLPPAWTLPTARDSQSSAVMDLIVISEALNSACLKRAMTQRTPVRGRSVKVASRQPVRRGYVGALSSAPTAKNKNPAARAGSDRVRLGSQLTLACDAEP